MRPDNIIKVSFGGLRTVVSAHRYQYDYGQVLLFNDLDLPESYEVHFSNEEYGKATVSLGDDSGVLIPDIYFTTGEPVYAWLFLHNEADDGRTLYTVKVPVKKRAKPENVEPTPVEQSIIEQAITALNNAVDKTTASEYAAKESELLAKESEDSARTSAESAGASSELAGQYASDASAASDEASRYAESARVYSEQANQNADVAQTAKTSAETAAGTAIQKASEASDSASTASTAAQTATAKANEASASATTASGAASTATQKAAEAAQKATEATEAKTAAENARDSAEAAQTASETAQAKAEEAATHLTIDPTLTQQGQAADAKKVGDEISDLKSAITHIGVSDSIKVALLDCFRNVVWINDQGQTYYDALEDALYAEEYPRITAIYTQGANVVYTDDTLDSLKPHLTVKLYGDVQDTGTVIASANYSLSGTLTEGTSIITVTYGSLRTTVMISGVIDFYNIWRWEWNSSGGNLTKIHGSSEPGQTDLSMYPSGAALNNPYEQRRTYCTERGVAQYYEYLQTAVPTQYYPIPIPANANHVKVTTMPTGQFIYLTFYEFNGVKYDPRLGRTTWTEMSNGSYERDLSLGSGNQRFLIFNTKYDSVGESYPVEPTSMLIEFSEV